jgi:hypothetical protein
MVENGAVWDIEGSGTGAIALAASSLPLTVISPWKMAWDRVVGYPILATSTFTDYASPVGVTIVGDSI